MSYYVGCDCSAGKSANMPVPCRGCGDTGGNVEQDLLTRQRKIWNTVRVPTSLYTMNLAALNVQGGAANAPIAKYAFVNWNQSSDRAIPSVQTACVPTRGNSLRSSLTANSPGAMGPCGAGVDIKHDSYARYLARKKASSIKTNKRVVAVPVEGNKSYPLGIVAGCVCPPQ